MENKREQFKKELSDLLKKFNAEILLVDNEEITIEFNWDPNKEDNPTKEISLGGFACGDSIEIPNDFVD